MKYYVVERISSAERTAWSKARADAERIAEREGFKPIEVQGTGNERANSSALNKLNEHRKMGRLWKSAFKDLKKGDILFVQLPLVNNYLFMKSVVKNLKRRGVRVIALIHDLETLRMIMDKSISFKQKMRMRIEEIGLLKECSRLIVHNDKMLDFVKELGINTPMTVLKIFDYLIAPSESGVTVEELADKRMKEIPKSVIVAGNLDEHKSGYIYEIPDTVSAELYGVHYKENDKKNLHYNGSFPADELPYELCNGFGLIWDGSAYDTCIGAYGEYLRYNNPHKTSLYLASAIPVIIWDKAALAEFVEKYGVGFTVSSISDIPDKLNSLTDEQYKKIYQNVKNVSKKLCHGEFLCSALGEACREDV